MANSVTFTKALTAASATNIATSQAAVAGTPLTLNGSAVTAGVATLDTQRRVLITSTSATETAVITIFGTNQQGTTISETVTFSGSSTTLVSNLDYLTVTKIVPSGTIAGSLSAGTNTIGSSPWVSMNYQGMSPMNVSAGVELVSGSGTYSVEYTYDDPNNLASGVTFPFPWTNSSPGALVTATATKDGLFNFPFIAMRLTITVGTGTFRAYFLQAGIG